VRLVDRTQPESVALSDMTSGQLARRAKIIEAVIGLIADLGADAVQMRDVAQRSGVALATVYRYFRSKEHLVAAALEDWQKKLTRRTLAAHHPMTDAPLVDILNYLERAQRAFHRNPKMTALMLQTMMSNEPEAKAAIDHMNQTTTEMFVRLLEGLPAEDIPYISFGLNAALTSALSGVLAGMLTFEESRAKVEWVARSLIDAHAC
jgi:AcrR family transcriptional regulator